jgi:glycosyltransferase involved in cell wall biosynthesis
LKNNVLISIIIPCYNSEHTLEDTLVSVKDQNFVLWEAIIINDGSTDNSEAIALKFVERDARFRYFKKLNGGLGSARNFGIEKAFGEYILPLDADNKIRPLFAIQALPVFQNDNSMGVVYGDAMYFGEKTGLWKIGPFSIHKMLKTNYIDACAIIRKSVFLNISLYDVNMPYQGLEDWDLWLSFINRKIKFYYLEKITFDYRVSKDSMIKTFTTDMRTETVNYIKEKHRKLFIKALFRVPSKYGLHFWLDLLKEQIGLKKI